MGRSTTDDEALISPRRARTLAMSGWLARIVPGRDVAVAMLLLAVFVLLQIGSNRHKSIIIEEPVHYQYGWKILHFDSTKIEPGESSKMPFSALNALPRWVAWRLLPRGSLRRQVETIEFSRYVTVAAGVLLGWLVFRWTQALYGGAGALLALTLYAFDPNILTHSGIVSADLYATWMVALTVWTFWRFLNHDGPGTWRWATASALVFALAQVAKYTAAYLVPILLLIAVGHAGPTLWADARRGAWGRLAGWAGRGAGWAALYVAAYLAVVNLAYWGEQTFQPLAASHFQSSQFQRIQTVLAPLPWVRIPVPWPYVEGMDWVFSLERLGANVYLLGEMGKGGEAGLRFPEYYAVSWLYKEPIATQLLMLLALVAYLARVRRFDFRRNEWFLAAPTMFFVWYFGFVFNYQAGFRYVLVMLPVLVVFTGSLLAEPPALGGRGRAVVGVLVVYLVVSVLSYYPHFLPYFNELVWDRKMAYKVLADASLVQDENHWYVRQYLRRHPEVILEPDGPTAGAILVRVEFFVGLFYVEQFRWLRENFAPVGHVAHGHLLFRVTPEALRRVTDPLSADWVDQES
jgi:hypothetical protein